MPVVALSKLYERLGPRYFTVARVMLALSAFVITWATIGFFSLYESLSAAEFWEVVIVSEVFVALGIALVLKRAQQLAEPLAEWLRAGRPREGALDAWRTAVALPRDYVMSTGWWPPPVVLVPIATYFTLRFDLPAYDWAVVFAGGLLAFAYSGVLEFFAAEVLLRPLVLDAGRMLPADFPGQAVGVPLRWKLLGALPVINVITGVIVSGLSTDGRTSLGDLGIDVIVAVIVALTVSFELTLLLTKSVLRPIDDLLKATERVKQGDFDARAPLTSGDEMGTLANSFNEMMRGLSEREALRQAFGSYVDPEVAERILEEGELLQGQEREVTVMFVDVRGFTPFAERSSARETVAFLNDFFELVVPIIAEHGGHANKFLGDGLLGVFGAPERLSDHADRTLAAACQIVPEVERRFGGEVRIGTGLNSGPVVIGSVGGGGRLEFTVIGDAVNVAARVEAATRETGDVILLTEATRCLLEREVELEPRGEIELKGVAEPVPVYAAATPVDVRTTPERRPLTAEA